MGVTLLAFGCGNSTDLVPPLPDTTGQGPAPTATYRLLKQDILINADLWDTEPRMMAAGLGFTEIIGVAGLARAE